MKALLYSLTILSIISLAACEVAEVDDTAARARFDEILSFSPELDSITCLNDDCNSSVVYFNYNSLPDEGLEQILGMNAVTYSNWKSENIGGSNVTIYANLNGTQVLQCDAGGGVLKGCQ